MTSSTVSGFHVVKNAEEQYSLYPTFKEVPGGWEVEKTFETREECLEYIESVWTDIRPKSLRDSLAIK